MKRLRCAIYTRKSTDEGLDQSFNSLDAQREACAAFILSQAGEGWSPLKEIYDDGGFSGGTMERPALKRLLAEVEAGRVDVIVVYKVDRLTRSLADFARIVEILDRAGASFVSVTQAFNTTTSMGRLTLNVLLSFAQFEREVTGERIRDKIAASKARGMWMGGNPPLGYDVRDRALHVNAAEAETVRAIFQRYRKSQSVYALRDALDRDGIRSKLWVSRAGRTIGGAALTHGALYHILSSRLYIGEIVHRGKVYRGQHGAIIDADTFEAVQCKLADGAPAMPSTTTKGHRLSLLGRLFDDAGHPMTHAHANKRGRRYHYYVSTAVNARKPAGSLARVSAPGLETAIRELVSPLLSAEWRPHARDRVLPALQRIVLSKGHVKLDLDPRAVSEALDPTSALTVTRDADVCQIEAPLALGSMRGAKDVIAAGGASTPSRIDRALVRAVVLARRWADELAEGDPPSIQALADREDACPMYTGKLLPLAFLAPDLVEAILDGRQPSRMTLAGLIEATLPLGWADQRAFFSQFR
ncbi:MAG: hypothetical protein GC206_16410 [Alphaproteobacteria bacterium]|nr:hypothetical protein [Alphaproteobacteria bacterium]